MDPEEIKQKLVSMRKKLLMKQQQLERHKSRKRALEELKSRNLPSSSDPTVSSDTREEDCWPFTFPLPPTCILIGSTCRDFDSDETVREFMNELRHSGGGDSSPGRTGSLSRLTGETDSTPKPHELLQVSRKSPILSSKHKTKRSSSAKNTPQLRLSRPSDEHVPCTTADLKAVNVETDNINKMRQSTSAENILQLRVSRPRDEPIPYITADLPGSVALKAERDDGNATKEENASVSHQTGSLSGRSSYPSSPILSMKRVNRLSLGQGVKRLSLSRKVLKLSQGESGNETEGSDRDGENAVSLGSNGPTHTFDDIASTSELLLTATSSTMNIEGSCSTKRLSISKSREIVDRTIPRPQANRSETVEKCLTARETNRHKDVDVVAKPSVNSNLQSRPIENSVNSHHYPGETSTTKDPHQWKHSPCGDVTQGTSRANGTTTKHGDSKTPTSKHFDSTVITKRITDMTSRKDNNKISTSILNNATSKHLDSKITTTRTSSTTSKHLGVTANTTRISDMTTKNDDNKMATSRARDTTSKHLDITTNTSRTSSMAIKHGNRRATTTETSNTISKHGNHTATTTETSNTISKHGNYTVTTTETGATTSKYLDSTANTPTTSGMTIKHRPRTATPSQVDSATSKHGDTKAATSQKSDTTTKRVNSTAYPSLPNDTATKRVRSTATTTGTGDMISKHDDSTRNTLRSHGTTTKNDVVKAAHHTSTKHGESILATTTQANYTTIRGDSKAAAIQTSEDRTIAGSAILRHKNKNISATSRTNNTTTKHGDSILATTTQANYTTTKCGDRKVSAIVRTSDATSKLDDSKAATAPTSNATSTTSGSISARERSKTTTTSSLILSAKSKSKHSRTEHGASRLEQRGERLPGDRTPACSPARKTEDGAFTKTGDGSPTRAKGGSPVLRHKNKAHRSKRLSLSQSRDRAGRPAPSDSPSRESEIKSLTKRRGDNVCETDFKENERVCFEHGLLAASVVGAVSEGVEAKRNALTVVTESNITLHDASQRVGPCAKSEPSEHYNVDVSEVIATRNAMTVVTESNSYDRNQRVSCYIKSEASDCYRVDASEAIEAACNATKVMPESNIRRCDPSQRCVKSEPSDGPNVDNKMAPGPTLGRDGGPVVEASLCEGVLTVVQRGLVSLWRQTRPDESWSPVGSVERRSYGDRSAVGRDFLRSSRGVACCEVWGLRGRLTVEIYATGRDDGVTRRCLELVRSGNCEECLCVATEGSTVVVSGGSEAERFTLSEDLDRVSSNQTLETAGANIDSLHRVEGCPHVVAGWCSDRRLSVWHLESGLLLRRLTLGGAELGGGVDQMPTRLLWSADEKGFLFTLLQVNDSEIKLSVTNLMTKCCKELQTYRSPPNLEKFRRACCEGGHVLATFANGLVVWDLPSGVVTATTETEREPWLADGRAILVGDYSVDVLDT